jgi:hypothetical protein
MTMTTALAPSESLLRVHGRGLLLSILEKETILTRIRVLENGRFIAETKDWDSYWQPLHELNRRELEDSLGSLHFAWRDHILSRFNSFLRQEFCFRLFYLLDVLLSIYSKSDAPQSSLNALRTALGFECFGIAASTSDSEVLGAGTCTLRNPCYLLAKLKMPDVLDDPQFLTVITVANSDKPELFYHYRQYTVSPDSAISLLFYPAASMEKRAASFRLLNSLVGGVSYGIDPRTRERAQRLYHGIIHPIIEANNGIKAEVTPLELIDIGAGSGGLTASICRQILKMGIKPRFRLWFVDLEPSDPARFFRTKKIRAFIDSLTFLGDDYRSWLSRSQPLRPTHGLRIALVSKLFNNLSSFSVCRLSKEESLPFLSRMVVPSDLKAHRPSICLAQSGAGVKSLAISNTRVPLREGRTFAQVSLTDFYQGMYLMSRPKVPIDNSQDGIFLPVRSFNPKCLVTTDGKSIILRLAEICNYIIIEDADLKPQDLVNHFKEFSLRSFTAYDVTEALGMVGNYAYVVWPKNEAKEAPNLVGEQIW